MNTDDIKYLVPGKELLADLAARISLQDLREISQMDCRSEKDYIEDAPKHYEPLLRVKETLNTNDLGHWYPLEVIELYRWAKFGAQEIRQHTMRAFCCAIILHTHCDYSEPVTSCDTTLGNLIESLICIDTKLLSKAESLYSRMLASDLISKEDKVLVPVAQLISILKTIDEITLRHKLDEILKCEKNIIDTRIMNFEKNNAFFAKRDKPQSENGWLFSTNYLFECIGQIEDKKLKEDLLSLCKRLWNPHPDKYVPYPSIIYL